MTPRAIIDDPYEFITRLEILTKQNATRPFFPLWPETDRFVREGLLSPKKYVLAVKPRQVAFTTATTAYQFWKGYTSSRAHRCVQVVHEREAMVRLMEMVQVFHDGLPSAMQRGLTVHNEKRTRFGHNKAGFNRILAGGRGQGRSWSFNDAHFTEMAFYPSATAASAKDAAGSTAEGMWQSTLATLDDKDPHQKIVVESTGNGPRGLFYKLWKQARQDPDWAYIFVSWADVARYRIPLTPEQRDAFLASMSPDERELHGPPHQLDAEQLAWRRERMVTQGWTPTRFQREYPLTDLEPFMASMSGWFDMQRLNEMLSWTRHEEADGRGELRIFHHYEPGRLYFMGVDPAGGVGRDYAVIQVFRDDLLHVATWMSNTAHPRAIAAQVARMGGWYGGNSSLPPLCVVEANNHGIHVLARLRAMGDGKGVRLWRDPETGADFWSSGATTDDRKRAAMLWAREIIEDGRVIIECRHTIHQLAGIVEKWNGKIEAASDDAVEIEDKDDLAMAAVFALWAARSHVSPRSLDTLERERERIAARVRDRWRVNAE